MNKEHQTLNIEDHIPETDDRTTAGLLTAELQNYFILV